MGELLKALLQQVVVPEIVTAIRAHHNATGTLPTTEQVLAALGADTAAGIAIGEAWLAAHKSPTT